MIKKRILKRYIKSTIALFTSRWGFKREEKEYYLSYSKEQAVNKLSGCIIVMFDGRQIHCGITDRLKGICSIYEYSKKRGIPFYVYFRSPFLLEDYLLPNTVDWRVKDDDVMYNQNVAVPVFLNTWQSMPSFHVRYLDAVVKKNPDKQIHVYGNSTCYINSYAQNFHILFKWSERVEKMAASCHNAIGSNKYIAIAMRFQQLLGDFKEEHANYTILEAEEREALMKKCHDKIKDIIKEKNIKSRVLVTCDSTNFLEYIAQDKQIYVIPGSVAHIDNAHTKSMEIYDKLFLDMVMLSQAQHIYQLITGEMYKNSGFAQQAAATGNVNYEQIYF